VTLGGEHVAALKAETGPMAGQMPRGAREGVDSGAP
jgi:hypothetical protein